MIAQTQYNAAVGHLTNDRPDLALQMVEPLLGHTDFGPDAQHLSALANKREGRIEIAVQTLETLVTAYPGFSQAWYNLGVCYGESERRLQAICCYRSCLRSSPDHADAMWNLAEALRLEEQFDAALTHFLELEKHEPYCRYGDLYHRKAVCLTSLGQAQAAIRDFQRALRLGTTDSDRTRWESSQAHLMVESLSEGWSAYEHRFAASSGSGVTRHDFHLPWWRGQSLRGRRLCVHAEQGLGDQIMFASILPELIDEADDVLLAVHPALVDLFRTSFKCQTVVAHSPDHPTTLLDDRSADYQVAIGSLPKFRRWRRSDFSHATASGYLRSGGRRQRYFSHVLDGLIPARRDRRCVGVMWGANPCHGLPDAARRSRHKSLPVEQLGAIAQASPETTFVSLQNIEVASEAGACGSVDLVDCHRYLNSMADTAALISQLDLVISVDTGVAHLTAALGKPLWLLLMQRADWRWGQHSTDCLWYPRARLYRQRRQGDWSGVVNTVAEDLAAAPHQSVGG